jgi:hypothetical protein
LFFGTFVQAMQVGPKMASAYENLKDLHETTPVLTAKPRPHQGKDFVPTLCRIEQDKAP